MTGLVEKAKRFYSPELQPGEEIRQVRHATAAGTGIKVVLGALIGALAGWLVAFVGDLALLPPLVMGALAGQLVGYVLSHRQAVGANGAGSVHLELVLTNKRLLTAKRYAALRRGMLRSYPLDDMAKVDVKRYQVGKYHRIEVTLRDGAVLSVVSDGAMDIPVNTGRGSG